MRPLAGSCGVRTLLGGPDRMYSALRDAALLVLMVTAHFLLPVFALRPVGPFPPLRPDVNKSSSSKPLQLTGDFLPGFVFFGAGWGGWRSV